MNGKEATAWSIVSICVATTLCFAITTIRGCEEAKIEANRSVKEAAAEAAKNGALVIELEARP